MAKLMAEIKLSYKAFKYILIDKMSRSLIHCDFMYIKEGKVHFRNAQQQFTEVNKPLPLNLMEMFDGGFAIKLENIIELTAIS